MSETESLSEELSLTGIYVPGEDGWIVAYCPEVPGAVSQGRTLEEARFMLRDAVALMLEGNREERERELFADLNEKEREGLIREPLIG